MAVAVVVDGAAEILRRHHLGLAELAGPGADHLLRAQVAAFNHAQRIEQARAEQLGPAAVIGERRERRQHRLLAGAGAEIALQSPERDDHRRRYAEVLVDALEDGLMLLDHLAAALDAVGRQQLLGEVEEVLREEPLAAVDIDDALVEFQERRGGGDRRGGNLLGGGLAFEFGQPLVEIRGVAAVRLAEGHGRQPPRIRASRGRAADGRPAQQVPAVRRIIAVRYMWEGAIDPPEWAPPQACPTVPAAFLAGLAATRLS